MIWCAKAGSPNRWNMTVIILFNNNYCCSIIFRHWPVKQVAYMYMKYEQERPRQLLFLSQKYLKNNLDEHSLFREEMLVLYWNIILICACWNSRSQLSHSSEAVLNFPHSCFVSFRVTGSCIISQLTYLHVCTSLICLKYTEEAGTIAL